MASDQDYDPEEFFQENDAPMTVNNPPGQPDDFVPALLPAVQKRMQRTQQDEAEVRRAQTEIFGDTGSHKLRCLICEIDQTSESRTGSEMLALFEMSEMEMRTTDEELFYQKFVEKGNQILFRAVQTDAGQKWRGRKFSIAECRLHFNTHRRTPLAILWRRVDALEEEIKHLEESGNLYVQDALSPDSAPIPNVRNQALYERKLKQIVDLLQKIATLYPHSSGCPRSSSAGRRKMGNGTSSSNRIGGISLARSTSY